MDGRKIKTMRTITQAAIALSLAVAATAPGFCQSQLQFIGVTPTIEGAIQLTWTSVSNEAYEIDEADALNTNFDGTTTWNVLYTDYPSQGTNTFWLDTGNYFNTPIILHPKQTAMRFYRIADLGPDTTTDEPTVSITSVTDGAVAVGGLTVTVVASTDQYSVSTQFYVDGEEVSRSDGTNAVNNATTYVTNYYTINTCEWPNGPHTLFATAECLSGPPDPLDAGTIAVGHAVSPFVNVTFSNLITRVSFSEPFFDPTLGETQQVSAVFAANVDWTLQIQDGESNTVRTATGSGGTMSFDWDGTGTGGASLPGGVYLYVVSAQTNGQSLPNQAGFGGGGSSPPPPSAPSMLSQTSGDTESFPTSPQQARAAGLDYYYVPVPPMPPVRTNGTWVPWEDVFGPSAPTRVSVVAPPAADSAAAGAPSGAFAADGASAPAASYAGASRQSTTAPTRNPTVPMNKPAGKFGVFAQFYGTNTLSIAPPTDGIRNYPTPSRVSIEGRSQDVPSTFAPLTGNRTLINGFMAQMAKGAWQPGFAEFNGAAHASDLKDQSLGGANIFNTSNVSLGWIEVHGAYGTSPDVTTGSEIEQVYFAIDGRQNGSPSTWVRTSDMNFGSPGASGLKWIAILACNSLRQFNWESMQNGGITPFNGNLHLLMGADSVINSDGIDIWPKFMLGLNGRPPETIMQAWYDSGGFDDGASPVNFAVAGYDDCQQDLLSGTNSVTPTGSIFYISRTVRP
jgi:hypothetical protein